MTKPAETFSHNAHIPTSVVDPAPSEAKQSEFVSSRAKTFNFQSREKFEWLCSATELIDTARRDFRENARRS